MLSFFTVRVMAYICAALGAIIVGLSVWLWVQDVRLGKMENQRDKAQHEVAKAWLTIKGQVALLTECDRATHALRVESDKKAIAAAQALARAQAEARRYQQANQKRAALLASPTPSGAGCSQAIATIRPELRK